MPLLLKGNFSNRATLTSMTVALRCLFSAFYWASILYYIVNIFTLNILLLDFWWLTPHYLVVFCFLHLLESLFVTPLIVTRGNMIVLANGYESKKDACHFYTELAENKPYTIFQFLCVLLWSRGDLVLQIQSHQIKVAWITESSHGRAAAVEMLSEQNWTILARIHFFVAQKRWDQGGQIYLFIMKYKLNLSWQMWCLKTNVSFQL